MSATTVAFLLGVAIGVVVGVLWISPLLWSSSWLQNLAAPPRAGGGKVKSEDCYAEAGAPCVHQASFVTDAEAKEWQKHYDKASEYGGGLTVGELRATRLLATRAALLGFVDQVLAIPDGPSHPDFWRAYNDAVDKAEVLAEQIRGEK